MRHFEAPEVGADPVDQEDVDVDRARRERVHPLAPEPGLDAARQRLELERPEFRAQLGGDVEESRAVDRAGRRRLIERRYRLDADLGPQALQGAEQIRLPVAQIRPDSHVDRVHVLC